MNKNFFPNVEIHCNKIELLDKDSNRKRFIDVVASVIGRNYLDTVDPKYLSDATSIISKGKNIEFEYANLTQKTIEDFKKLKANMPKH